LERHKAQIVAAATKLFGRQGYFGMTMQEVADEAGIAVGLIYRYTPSKEELLLLAIGEIRGATGGRLRRILRGAGCRREAAMLAYHQARAVGPAGRERRTVKEVRPTGSSAPRSRGGVGIDFD
jgi:AcrR family transcriptional regulator